MIQLTHFTGGIAATNGYLLQSGDGALVVDAPEGMCAWLEHQNVKVKALLLTHQHFDHVMDAAAIKEASGCPIYAFAPFSRDLTLESLFGMATGMSVMVREFSVDEMLEGRQETGVLGSTWQLMHVPGHSPDSVCFYQREKNLLFGGDVLFLDGVGRTDFPGGGMELLVTGIQQKLLPLPDETRVFPGHGDDTTIGRERAENPFLE
jgi:glyoxylase-like metal-dependent hydrolase (beta-lactamase superfamily II)